MVDSHVSPTYSPPQQSRITLFRMCLTFKENSTVSNSYKRAFIYIVLRDNQNLDTTKTSRIREQYMFSTMQERFFD